MAYRKSYKGFIAWLLGMFAGLCLCALLPIENEMLRSRIVLNACFSYVALLTGIIWQTEAIYWYNGVEFEEAKQAGSERRRAYALRHAKRFGAAAVLCALFSVGMHILGASIWLDILIESGLFIAIAISTIGIKL